MGGIVLFLLIFRKEIVGAAQSIFQRYMEDPIFVTKKHEPLRVPYVQYAEDRIFKALEPTYLPEGYKEIDRKTKDTSQSILYKDRAGGHCLMNNIFMTLESVYFKSTEVFIQDTKVEIVKGVQIKEKTIGVYWRGAEKYFFT